MVCVNSFLSPYEMTKFLARRCNESPSLMMMSVLRLLPMRMESLPSTLLFSSLVHTALLAVFSEFIDCWLAW